VKVTVITQLAPAASVAPQVDVCVNTFKAADWDVAPVAPASPNVMPSIERACDPALVTVTASGELDPIAVLGKVSDEVERVATEVVVAAVPVPLKGTTCGLLPASLVTVSVALNVAVELGVNVIRRLQFAAAGSDAVQVLDETAKADAPGPVMAGEIFVSAVLPMLESVTSTASLVVFTV
jgi:hypothetical protein